MSSATPLSLQGKIAIITGSSRGIGAGLALELATRGAKVRYPSIRCNGKNRPLNIYGVTEINLGGHHLCPIEQRDGRR